jgi:hypothetical protein
MFTQNQLIYQFHREYISQDQSVNAGFFNVCIWVSVSLILTYILQAQGSHHHRQKYCLFSQTPSMQALNSADVYAASTLLSALGNLYFKAQA